MKRIQSSSAPLQGERKGGSVQRRVDGEAMMWLTWGCYLEVQANGIYHQLGVSLWAHDRLGSCPHGSVCFTSTVIPGTWNLDLSFRAKILTGVGDCN